MSILSIYDQLRNVLKTKARENDISKEKIIIRCRALSAYEAIGDPEHKDYPIIKGKEVMVEASFMGAKGQAFTDQFENARYSVEDLLNLGLGSNRQRASFIAGFNAVFRHLGLCEKTIHCKDKEPVDCANHLLEMFKPKSKVLLIGHQPRFLEKLASKYDVRVIDMDPDNIGKSFFNTEIEAVEKTLEAIKWCDQMLVTGSTLVNNTISNFLDLNKPVVFYGVTISAPAKILGVNTYCHCGH
ncbi:MAG: DUF364 domain-containing protein [Candidatus Margulisiibacteriota bacterium]